MSEENKQEIKKEGFFKSVIKSIKDFDKYEDFALEQTSESVKYLFKLLLIFCICIAIASTFVVVNNVKDIYFNLKDKIPNFTYNNGELNIDEEIFIIEDYKDTIGSIIIDTNTELKDVEDKLKEEIGKYNTVNLFLKDGVAIIHTDYKGKMEYKYSDFLSAYNIKSGDKEQLMSYIDGLNYASVYFAILIPLLICVFIVFFIVIILQVLALAALGFFTSRIFRINIKFRIAINIAVHSITLPVILKLIYTILNLCTGFYIKYFEIMYYTISYIYVVVAILMIKTDFINRQIELMKIAQEELKIKEELNAEEKEEKKEEEEEKKEEENNNEKKDNKNTKERKTNRKKDKSTDGPIGDVTSTIHEGE